MATTQQQYTFANFYNAKTEKYGNQTMAVVMANVKLKKDGKLPAHGSFAINGRTKSINDTFKTSFSDNETVWVNITAFEKLGERLNNFFEKSGRESNLLMLFGRMERGEYNGKENLQMILYDFSATGKSDYSFLQFMNCEDGRLRAAIRGNAVKIKAPANEKSPAKASIPINKRTKLINKMLNTSFPDDVVWMTGNFWKKTGERIMKLSQSANRNSFDLYMVGTIGTSNYNGETRIEFNVDNFELVPNFKKDENGNSGEAREANTARDANTARAATTASEMGFSEIEEDEGDLPF